MCSRERLQTSWVLSTKQLIQVIGSLLCSLVCTRTYVSRHRKELMKKFWGLTQIRRRNKSGSEFQLYQGKVTYLLTISQRVILTQRKMGILIREKDVKQ